MPLRAGDTIVAQEEARLPQPGEPARSPARLVVEASVTWVARTDFRLRLPETKVLWRGEEVLLPATAVLLPLKTRQFSWHQQGFALLEAESWAAAPFYGRVRGRAVTAARADYYSPRLWQEHLASIDAPLPTAPRALLSEEEALLGVGPEASRAEIIEAFRLKAKAAHPDAGGDPEDFKRLLAARAALLMNR